MSIGFHPIDKKTGTGVKGQVAYWLVDDMTQTIEHYLEKGCTIYRGPIISVDSGSVAQLIDPLGNVIGLIEWKR